MRQPEAATFSVADIFAVGIGPSSSHTVGPMLAAKRFAQDLASEGADVVGLRCDLFGSLALTGRGHRTDDAVMLGLAGYEPGTVDPDRISSILAAIRERGNLSIDGGGAVPFDPDVDIVLHARLLPDHPNTMDLTAVMANGHRIVRRFFSLGGGAIAEKDAAAVRVNHAWRHPFGSAIELLAIGERTGMTIAQIVSANETAWRSEAQSIAFLAEIQGAMFASIDRGCAANGILPGGIGLPRRAGKLFAALSDGGHGTDGAAIFDWVSLYALAVSEENAAGGRIVTAPTNGAAGVIPAVLKYYDSFVPGATGEGCRRFLLSAAAVGMLFKLRASISAAEMGCQGEIGVACSMAAAGLAAALGGSNAQVENAAEIGMEHNLGLTCDPVSGLVQVPCVERNTMGAIKAINAAALALRGDGSHFVSLDQVIETMRQTGEDMKSQYKETSLGGLAVNVTVC
ncbi:MAG: L-serine ammonia-lyase [Sphingobium sp.]